MHARLKPDGEQDRTSTHRPPAPAPMPVEALLNAQRTAGNQAVGRMLARAVIPVYHRAPKNEEAKRKDRGDVDQFAQSALSGPNAGGLRSELTAGGTVAAVKLPEKIILCGHGNVQSMQGYSGVELADKLKTAWGLNPAYDGEIRIDSCKAGDTGGLFGFNATSLVEDVSNALQGFGVTVSGMKGSTITGLPNSAIPGMPRSLTSDRALDEYNKLEQIYKELERKRNADFQSGPGGFAETIAGSARLQLNLLEMRLKALEKKGEPTLTGLLSMVGITKSSMEEILEQIADETKTRDENTATAEAERIRVNLKYGKRIEAVLDKMNDMGTPFGNSLVTVRHGPEQRKGWLQSVSDVIFAEPVPDGVQKPGVESKTT